MITSKYIRLQKFRTFHVLLLNSFSNKFGRIKESGKSSSEQKSSEINSVIENQRINISKRFPRSFSFDFFKPFF